MNSSRRIRRCNIPIPARGVEGARGEKRITRPKFTLLTTFSTKGEGFTLPAISSLLLFPSKKKNRKRGERERGRERRKRETNGGRRGRRRGKGRANLLPPSSFQPPLSLFVQASEPTFDLIFEDRPLHLCVASNLRQ